MSIFDGFYSDDPRQQALISMGLGLLAGSGRTHKNFGADLAQAGLLGMQTYNSQRSQQAKMAEEAQQKELRQMQIDQARQAMQDSTASRALAARAFSPGVTPLTPNDDEGNPMPSSPAGGGLPEYMRGLMGINPKEAIALQMSMAKDSPYGKIDPKDYTPESLAAFAATRDFTRLRPRVKMEPVNTGADTRFVDPFNPGGPIAHSLSPADQQRIPMERTRVGVDVARARDEGVAVPGFMTGGAPGAAPVSAPIMRAPTAPVGPSAISPKQQREIAAKRAEDMPQDAATFSSTTAALDALAKSAKDIKDHPGLSSISGVAGAFPNAPGSNAANAEALMTTLRSKVAFNALQEMRNASKTGGALGSVSEKELAFLENSIAALDKTQDLKQRKEQLAKIEAYAANAKNRMASAMRQKYGEGFGKQQDPLGIR